MVHPWTTLGDTLIPLYPRLFTHRILRVWAWWCTLWHIMTRMYTG